MAKNKNDFQLWDASPSLQRIMLLSPSNQKHEQEENIVLTFWGVKYMQLPFSLKGMEIQKVNLDEFMKFSSASLSITEEDNIFCLTTNDGARYFIVAANYTSDTNQLDYFENQLPRM